jgi:putative two-component system response regulator
MLSEAGHPSSLAASAVEARALLESEQFELAICDIQLPDGSGLDLLAGMSDSGADLPVIIASGVSDPAIGRVATIQGAYGYLIKPFERDQLLITLRNALHRHRLEQEQRRHSELLERTVEARTRELKEAVAELTISRQETITKLMRALGMRDSDTGAHVERIGSLAESLARWAGLSTARARIIGLAAPMHDIGKIGVPDRVLLKQGPLTAEERAEIERHPEIGHEILVDSTTELLQLAATIAATHHEWYDGSGYPAQLTGEEIPIEGRITAICDVFDALHSDRHYRAALPRERALSIMHEERGTHFDPGLLDVFLDHYDEALEIAAAEAAGHPTVAGSGP